MTYDLDVNGGPHHIGICKHCGGFTGDCFDGLCDDCYNSQQIECAFCGEMREPDEIRTDGKCNECHQYDEMEKAAILKDAQGCWAGDW